MAVGDYGEAKRHTFAVLIFRCPLYFGSTSSSGSRLDTRSRATRAVDNGPTADVDYARLSTISCAAMGTTCDSSGNSHQESTASPQRRLTPFPRLPLSAVGPNGGAPALECSFGLTLLLCEAVAHPPLNSSATTIALAFHFISISNFHYGASVTGREIPRIVSVPSARKILALSGVMRVA